MFQPPAGSDDGGERRVVGKWMRELAPHVRSKSKAALKGKNTEPDDDCGEKIEDEQGELL